jgi:hypothetical protein
MIFPLTYVPNPPCQLSLWEETGVPGENPRLSAERWLFFLTLFTWGLGSSHIEKFSLRFEPATLEVKGNCANHFATEAKARTASVLNGLKNDDTYLMRLLAK